MNQILYDYEQLNATTWMYISSLIAVAVFFKFNRFWSVRNLDLVAIIALAPGLLMVTKGESLEPIGYTWLFVVTGVLLVRMLVDPLMVRRPLLEPNLSSGGVTFMGCALMVFLSANVITKQLTESDLEGAREVQRLLSRQPPPPDAEPLAVHGPGFPLLHLVATVPNNVLLVPDETLPEDQRQTLVLATTTRTMAILSHLAVVLGLVLIGHLHFGNARTGMAAAALYLVLPYTAKMVGQVDHVLPAALMVWAVAAYRRPFIAGVLIGLAAAAIYYPIFLAPLWTSFYWQRGRGRFLVGLIAALLLSVGSLVFTSSDLESFLAQLRSMLGWTSLAVEHAEGFWTFVPTAYRLTAATLYIALSAAFALWPARKDLGTLMSCSAALMLGAQFWHSPGGGLCMAWYLPLVLMTIFRPNLEDRVAQTVLGDGWFSHRPARRPVEQAA